MKYVLIFILITSLLAYDTDACISLYARHNIDVNIKTNKGWVRVCNNDKLKLYTITELSKYDKVRICDCLKNELNNNIKDRSIEVNND